MKLSTIELCLPSEQMETLRFVANRANLTPEHLASLICVIGLQKLTQVSEPMAIVILLEDDSSPSRTDAEDGDVRT